MADPIAPANGALAGCRRAAEFARQLPHDVAKRMHLDFSPTQLCQVVGDIVFGIAASSGKEVTNAAADMGAYLSDRSSC